MLRIAALLSLFACLFAADKAPTAEDMAKMMEMMKPGPEHKALAALAGDWDVACKFWMDPSQPAMESKGTSKFTVILDGRFVQQEFNGDMMGQPFKGMGVLGYDNTTKKYGSGWIDSMSTSMTKLDGTSSDGGKTIEYVGDMTCPEMNSVVKSRMVFKSVSADKFTMDMYMTPKDKEIKSGELVYTRKK